MVYVYKDGLIEKRRVPRLDCSMPVQYRLMAPEGTQDNKALAKNISQGGTRIVVDEYIPVNSKVALILSFPFKNKKVKAISKVVWSKRYSVETRYDLGIQFMNITETARKDIAQFVRSKL